MRDREVYRVNLWSIDIYMSFDIVRTEILMHRAQEPHRKEEYGK